MNQVLKLSLAYVFGISTAISSALANVTNVSVSPFGSDNQMEALTITVSQELTDDQLSDSDKTKEYANSIQKACDEAFAVHFNKSYKEHTFISVLKNCTVTVPTVSNFPAPFYIEPISTYDITAQAQFLRWTPEAVKTQLDAKKAKVIAMELPLIKRTGFIV